MSIPQNTRRRAAGYSLIEALVAMGIFTLGMTAIAALFPTALVLQRETVAQVDAKHFARNTRATVAALGFESAEFEPSTGDMLNNGDGVNDGVSPMPNDALDDWSAADRSYKAIDTDTTSRRAYWTPLAHDADPDPDSESWVVYIFVTRPRRDVDYLDKTTAPGTWAVPDGTHFPGVAEGTISNSGVNTITVGAADAEAIRAGDGIVLASGATYKVTKVDTSANTLTLDGVVTNVGSPFDYFWYAHPGDADPGASGIQPGPSTFVQILTLVDLDASGVGDGDIARY